MTFTNDNTVPLSALSMKDVPHVGGKNASLGELIGALSSAGVRVPDGFATTSSAYRRFLRQGGLDEKIQNAITALDVNDTRALSQTAGEIREWVAQAPLPSDLESDIRAAYRQMENGTAAVAVRSSATAEDMPDASFAGQQETFLNICGEDAVIDAVRLVFASLFTDRAVSYRHHQGYDKQDVALSVAVQRMVRSDLAASGVMFTLDTESGFEEVVFITGAYGLGENVVQGSVNPDEFYVYKPSLRTGKNAIIRRQLGDKADKLLFGDSTCVGGSVKNVRVEEAARRRFCITDDDVNTLARYAMAIEAHYGRHMDIEWAKDGVSGDIFIVQARPETVKSRATVTTISRYRILTKGAALAEGRAIGQKIGVGTARIVAGTADMHRVEAGDVLIADMTDPDWEPVMKRAAGIVTRRGGRTCHAAIIARELGVPAIVGCGDTLAGIADGGAVSVSCAEGDTGHVYEGETKFVIDEFASDSGAQLPIKLQINVANPDLAFEFSRLPTDGVGLARLEFIIARTIGFHPRCALEYTELPADLRQEVRKLAVGYDSPRDCYVGKIAEGVATIAAAFHPRPVVVRLSDFKSNEYAGLVGGRRFEPIEENPMIGFRGAARYVDASFADCFALECEAMQRVREDMGIDNIWLMVPFVRTVNEAEAVVQKMRTLGISRDDWKIIMMCEVPANALLAEQFLDHFDGFSIGSNDLTQLTLALDRDSELVSGIFDERNLAVKMMISRAIQACREQNKYVGICGQAPSDYPDFAKWLMEEGISAISLNPDSVIEARIHLASKS